MYKDYQIKWLFILSGILIVSTLLLRQESLADAAWWQFLDYSLKIFLPLLACWMINGFFMIHQFSFLSNAARYIIGICAAIAVTFGLTYLFFLFMPQNYLTGEVIAFHTFADLQRHFASAFFLSLICYVVFYSVHTNSNLQNTMLEKEILEQAHLRAQLISLQQQISPHFLFNSLSTLKTIAPDTATKNYVLQLASVYRYVLNFNEQYLTPLEDEINFIKSYIYILNERFEESLDVVIDVADAHKQLLLPSLSLQLLLENAIKHNMLSPENPLMISIKTGNTTFLTVENTLMPMKVPTEGTGMGLKNIIERYKLLVNKPIEISRENGKFSVTLPLLKK